LVETIRVSEGKEYIKVGSLRQIASKQFNPRQQHDSAEFVLYLLSSMQEEMNAFFREV
jgi:uncharacterized UBP type Zn finger protein